MSLNSFFEFYSSLFDPEKSILITRYRFLPFHFIINLQKGGTLIMFLFLMWYYQNNSLGCWVYAALHGSYGLIWILKDIIFPDKGFRIKIDVVTAVMLVGVLGLYWNIGFQMVSGKAEQNPSPIRIFICINMYVFGVLLMVLTDFQKYLTLQFKKGLIDNYFLSTNRNTNYFGEVLLYLSFAILVNEYSSFVILISIWSTIFFSRIYIKEQSLRKKEGYSRYAENSYLLLFKIFRSDFLNLLLYSSIALGSVYCYYNLSSVGATLEYLHIKYIRNN